MKSKEIKNISVAFIGFEYEHHVPAAKNAILRLKDNNINCVIKIWSGSPGLREDIQRSFTDCKFLDSYLGWLGYLSTSSNDERNMDVKLSNLEIKHLAYTYSRTTLFKDPRKTAVRKIRFFESLVCRCIIELQKSKVSHVFFVELPHSLLDLSIYYAAQRLGLSAAFKEGPYFGGDLVYPVVNGKRNFVADLDHELVNFISSSLSKRDLNKNLEVPKYMRNDLSYLPSTKSTKITFFRTQVGHEIYQMSGLAPLAKFLELNLGRFAALTSVFYRSFILKHYSTKQMPPHDSQFILVLLQFHPEQTTSPAALDTPFEEERVDEVARRFPSHNIVVREHPSNLKRGSNLFHQYRSLKSLKIMLQNKNVRYMMPGGRSEYKLLLERAAFTVSTSGTVAMESPFLCTPTVHFCNSFAEGLPGVLIVEKVTDISIAKVNQARKELENMSNKELLQKCGEVFAARCLEVGFLTGFHENEYTIEEYITNAENVIFTSLTQLTEVSAPS